MHSVVNKISVLCLKKGIVEEEDISWFVYGLEKRITTAITATVFLIIAIFTTNVWTALSYLGSFYFLRVRTNGYHAKSFLGCFVSSLLLELLFLLLVLPRLGNMAVYILGALNLAIIFLFAPYDHPNMHLDRAELQACRKSSRRRISALTVLMVISRLVGAANIAYGITLGNTMAALLLVIAKIKK